MNNNFENIGVVIDLTNDEVGPTGVANKTGYGFYIYVNNVYTNSVVYQMIKNLSLWGGSTNISKERKWFAFEMPYTLFNFFGDKDFEKFVCRLNTKTIIYRKGEGNLLQKFYDEEYNRF